jgi:flavin-dependent dehydrogenase
MTRCDVLVVGGGPAGSTCATRLVKAGLDVVVLDKASFPRDKVCGGWITPAVAAALDLDLAVYGAAHALQPFTGFSTGSFDNDPVLTDFRRPISYGIRRCEFDDYLLRRSRARVIAGRPLETLNQDSRGWVANDDIHAPVIVGAGGHFCPVARWLNPASRHEDVVVAQEIEYLLDPHAAAACRVRPEWPELYFWPDLQGYGWCMRKGDYLKVGAGRLRPSAFPAAIAGFKALIERRGRIGSDLPGPWKGHAYLLNRTSSRRVSGDGMLLVGDAAGLALAPSGEGILAAVESGILAAGAIITAFPDCAGDRMAAYARQIDARFGTGARYVPPRPWPAWVGGLAARAILRSPRLMRRIVIEHAFLHVGRVSV